VLGDNPDDIIKRSGAEDRRQQTRQHPAAGPAPTGRAGTAS